MRQCCCSGLICGNQQLYKSFGCMVCTHFTASATPRLMLMLHKQHSPWLPPNLSTQSHFPGPCPVCECRVSAVLGTTGPEAQGSSACKGRAEVSTEAAHQHQTREHHPACIACCVWALPTDISPEPRHPNQPPTAICCCFQTDHGSGGVC